MAYIKKHTETRPDESIPFWEYFSSSAASAHTPEQVYAYFQMAVTERFPDPLTRIRITAWLDEEAYNVFKNDSSVAANILEIRAYNETNGITVVDTTDWAA